MLLSLEHVRARYEHDKEKLDRIIELRNRAPEKYRQWTENLANIGELFTYSYHAGIIEHFLGADEKKRVLDWGAGLGHMSYLLKDEYAVDAYNPVQDEYNDYWHEQFQLKTRSFQSASGAELPHKAESFDAVLSSGVLEHVFEFGLDEVTALRQLHRVLKQEGLLFIWHLPLVGALAEHNAMRKRTWRHIRRYELDEVLVMLSQSGFDVVAIERGELVFSKLHRLLGGVLGAPRTWALDMALCRLPVLSSLAHHFTIVARKVEGFPSEPARGNYTAYIA
ncbi:MAG: class I SAM-dependent methyltransferase [Patescibacteria group bacterium]|jgi:SAM-dependent methyltransferase